MTTHTLKTHPAPFQAVLDGSKRHEIRKADRPFAVGDVLEMLLGRLRAKGLAHTLTTEGSSRWGATTDGALKARAALVRVARIAGAAAPTPALGKRRGR